MRSTTARVSVASAPAAIILAEPKPTQLTSTTETFASLTIELGLEAPKLWSAADFTRWAEYTMALA